MSLNDKPVGIGILVSVATGLPTLLVLSQSGFLGLLFIGIYLFPALILYTLIFGLLLIVLRRIAPQNNLVLNHIFSAIYALSPAILLISYFYI